MKQKIETVLLAICVFFLYFTIMAMTFVTAFPYDAEQEKIYEENQARADIRVEYYQELNEGEN